MDFGDQGGVSQGGEPPPTVLRGGGGEIKHRTLTKTPHKTPYVCLGWGQHLWCPGDTVPKQRDRD